MALDNEIDKVNTDVLQGIKGVPDSNINADDFSNWVPNDLSPAQKAVYQQQQAARRNPSTGALSPMDYYPDLHHQIGVGSYGGSEIGSTTLFAPGGGLVPLGMMDARDAAVNHAALLKAKELQDFHNKWQETPSSKLVNINAKDHEEYQNFLKNAWGGAMKKAGNDPHLAAQYIETSPEFKARHQSFIDRAKIGDDVANKMAQDEVAIKEGKFYPDENYFALKHQLLTAASSSHPDFSKLSEKYRTWDLHRSISQTAEEVMDKAVKEQAETAYASPDATGGIRTGSKSNLAYSEKTLADAAEQVHKMTPGSDLSEIKKHINQKYGAIVHNETAGLTQPNEEGRNLAYYKNAQATAGGTLNTGREGAQGGEGVVNQMYTHSTRNTSPDDTKKVLSFAQSQEHSNLSTGELSNEKGNFQGNVQDVSVIPFNKKTGRAFTPQEVASGILKDNPEVSYKTKVIVNTTPKKDNEGNEIGGSNQVFAVNPDAVIGRVSPGFDAQIKKAQEEAKQQNIKHAEASVTPAEGEERAVQGGTAIFKNGKWQMK